MSSVKRVKYLIKKHPSKATTPNRIIITQNPIQHRHVRNSTSNCLQNWNAVKKNRAILNSVSLGIYSKIIWSRIVTFHLCDWLNSPAPFSFKQSPACLRFSRAWPAKPFHEYTSRSSWFIWISTSILKHCLRHCVTSPSRACVWFPALGQPHQLYVYIASYDWFI